MASGGKRPGAGRPPGRKTSPAKLALAERARGYTDLALKTLADIARKGESESARATAAIALLDRGYGRPWQAPPYEPPMAQPAPETSQPAAPSGENVVVFDKNELRARYLGAVKPGGTGG